MLPSAAHYAATSPPFPATNPFDPAASFASIRPSPTVSRPSPAAFSFAGPSTRRARPAAAGAATYPLDFGRHRGKTIGQCPLEYIEWLLDGGKAFARSAYDGLQLALDQFLQERSNLMKAARQTPLFMSDLPSPRPVALSIMPSPPISPLPVNPPVPGRILWAAKGKERATGTPASFQSMIRVGS